MSDHLSPFQTGPPSGTDKVKKGGSYMCHKVKRNTTSIVCFSSFSFFFNMKLEIVFHICDFTFQLFDYKGEILPPLLTSCKVVSLLVHSHSRGRFVSVTSGFKKPENCEMVGKRKLVIIDMVHLFYPQHHLSRRLPFQFAYHNHWLPWQCD